MGRWPHVVAVTAAAGMALAAALSGCAPGGGGSATVRLDSAYQWLVLRECLSVLADEGESIRASFNGEQVQFRYRAVTGDGRPVWIDPAPGELEYLQSCVTRHPFDTRVDRLRLPQQRSALWDYYRAVLVPCLEDAGDRDLPPVPSRKAFVDGMAAIWRPHAFTSPATVEEALALQAACPSLPPTLAGAVRG